MKKIIGNIGIILLLTLSIRQVSNAQDLEPRAYARVPINITILSPGFSYSKGNVVTDPAILLKDLNANVETFSLGLAHTFNLFGLSAQALAVLPFSFVNASAQGNGQLQTANRTGTADMRFRLSVLLLGGQAQKLQEFVKNNKPRTILGTSLTIQPPTGQYYPDKLINIGTGRWAFKPEIALSQPLGKQWLLDLYSAVWLFTKNNSFFPGQLLRSQNAIYTIQSHASYNIKPNLWAAFDATYYAGGNSTINGVAKDDQVSNFRLGGTLVLPTGKRSGLRLSLSKGAVVVKGTNFTTIAVGWNYSWF